MEKTVGGSSLSLPVEKDVFGPPEGNGPIDSPGMSVCHEIRLC